MPSSKIPTIGSRCDNLTPSISAFLRDHPSLHLGGTEPFTTERAHHLTVFGIQNLHPSKTHPINRVEFTAIRSRHGTIPIRILYPTSGRVRKEKGEAGALIYFHGGGYTVGSVDEFENGLRYLAEESCVQVYAVEYRLAPEWRYPTQLDEYDAVIDWVQGHGGKERGVHPDRVCGGGDSAGGNMTAAICLRRKDEGKKGLRAQMLLYPEARLPFDTLAATENNSGYYLETNGIFSFADHYLPRGIPPAGRYVSPGMQKIEELVELPPAAVFTSGFDPLRDVGVEFAKKLEEAGNRVCWRHYSDMTHGWLQMTAWSKDAKSAVKDVAEELEKFAYRGE